MFHTLRGGEPRDTRTLLVSRETNKSIPSKTGHQNQYLGEIIKRPSIPETESLHLPSSSSSCSRHLAHSFQFLALRAENNETEPPPYVDVTRKLTGQGNKERLHRMYNQCKLCRWTHAEIPLCKAIITSGAVVQMDNGTLFAPLVIITVCWLTHTNSPIIRRLSAFSIFNNAEYCRLHLH